MLLEVSHTRIFSFKFFYFFTYLVIGVALLGLGAAGVATAIAPVFRRAPLDRIVARASVVGGMSIVGGFALIARTKLTTFDIPLTYSEPAKLALVCVALFAAFLAIGLSVSSILSRNSSRVAKLYCADLAGAALGCAAAVPLMAIAGPVVGVMLSAAALLLAGVRAAWREGIAWTGATGCLLALMLVLAIRPDWAPAIVVDRSKHLRTDNPAVPAPEFSEWGPFFRIDVVDGGGTNASFKAVLHDGLIGSTLQEFRGDLSALTRFDSNLRRLPFCLQKPAPKELIIGAAGGHEILAALYFGAGSITGVEINPVTYSLVREIFADYTGRLFAYPNVQYINNEGRSFLTQSTDRFDIINFVSPDSYSATNSATSSAFVMSESYLYTVEMVMESLSHLNTDGLICMELGEFDYTHRPTRTATYVATAREAFYRMGIHDFANHVVVIRAPGLHPTSTILLKREPFSTEDMEKVRASVAKVAGATLACAPGVASSHGGAVQQIIQMPYDHLSDWYDAYEYDVGPVFDDAPFFWHFARFRDVMYIMAYDTPINVEVDFEYGAGERVLLFTLGWCTAFAAIALLLPFLFVRRTWRALPCKGRAALYFAMLGLGFMAVEICLIQKLTLLLGYPTYSLTVTLMAMLAFAGLGSLVSSRYLRQLPRALFILLLTIGLSIVFFQVGLPRLTAIAVAWPLDLRALLCAGMLAPIAMAMGAFMPLGLRTVSALTEFKNEYIAWSWAINGFFSVIGSTLTTILSMAYGFSAVLYLALALYTVAAGTLLLLSRVAAAVE